MQIRELDEELWLKFQRLNKDETLPITKKQFNKNNDNSFDHGFEMGRLDVLGNLLKIKYAVWSVHSVNGKEWKLDYKKLDAFSNNFVDVREWIDSHKIYVTDESSELYGFNSLDRNQDWDGKLIHESFTGNDRSWLICFNGKPIINNVEMQKMDYAKLENKFYDVDIKDGIVGIFTMK